jgi:hypothetical protein
MAEKRVLFTVTRYSRRYVFLIGILCIICAKLKHIGLAVRVIQLEKKLSEVR